MDESVACVYYITHRACVSISILLLFLFLKVMGLMHGKVDGSTMIVMDSFALPVEGTETRVNAQAQAYEYMTAYAEAAKLVGMSTIS